MKERRGERVIQFSDHSFVLSFRSPQFSILDSLYADQCTARFRASSRRILQTSAIAARPTKLLQGGGGLRPSSHRRRPRRLPSPADEPDFVYLWRGSDQ